MDASQVRRGDFVTPAAPSVTVRADRHEITERLALPRATVWYWIRDLPLDRPRRASAGQRKGNQGTRASYRRRREDAYARGMAEFDRLVEVSTFRDFVVLYIAEGYKRNRNVVSLAIPIRV